MAKKKRVPPTDKIEEQIESRSKQINYFINEYTVGYLADEQEKDVTPPKDGTTSNFYIPDYQREFVWDRIRISRFIESLVMGLPVPFIFYYENTKTGKLEIVDGSQRMRSIHAFIHGKFKLSKLERLTELSGKQFQDIPEARQRKIRNRSIRGIVLNEHADSEARQDLFNRINTGSLTASPAEIRRGSLQGPFMDLVIKLADDKQFKILTPTPSNRVNKREREELVTRFFAYGDGLKNYQNVVEAFLYKYVEKMNEAMRSESKLSEEYEKRFSETMAYVSGKFPLGFRKTENAKRITRVRFESIAVGTWMAIKKVKSVKKLQGGSISKWINCEEYEKLLRADGGNVIGKLKARINYVTKRLIEG